VVRWCKGLEGCVSALFMDMLSEAIESVLIPAMELHDHVI